MENTRIFREGSVNLYVVVLISIVIGIVIGAITPQILFSKNDTSGRRFLGNVALGLLGLDSVDPDVEIDLDDSESEKNSFSVRFRPPAAGPAGNFLAKSSPKKSGVAREVETKKEPAENSDARVEQFSTSSEPRIGERLLGASSTATATAASAKTAATAQKNDCAFEGANVPSKKVLINEIAWMGGIASSGASNREAAEREWIELKNNSERAISSDGWQIRDQSGKFKIDFENSEIATGGFMLLSRGDWNAARDLSYAGPLSNGGMWLKFFDDSCGLVDDVNAKNGWPAGDNSSKKTMERKTDGGWQSSAVPGGTPQRENSAGGNSAAAGSSSGGVSAATGETAGLHVSYSKLLITEIQIGSVSGTRDEMIEIYNPNTNQMSLAGWYIQKKSKSTSSVFGTYVPNDKFAGKSISGKGFFVIAHPSSSFTRDVESDYGIADDNTFVIKDPNGDITDKVGWGDASDCTGECAANPGKGENISRKSQNGEFQDTGQNRDDFEVRYCSSPGAFFIDCLPLALSSASGTLGTSTFSSSTYEGATSTTSIVDGVSSSSLEISSSTGNTSTSSASSSQSSSTLDFSSSTFAISSSSVSASTTATSTIEVSSSSVSSTVSDSSSTTSTSIQIYHLLIEEVRITGGEGKTAEDYIKIYNPADSAAEISNWKLRKRTKSGTEYSVKLFGEGSTIAPRGFFTWANSGNDFALSMGAQVSSTETLADNNSIALFNSSGTIVDALAWGEGHVDHFVEKSAFPVNPGAGEILKRKNFADADDNSLDFEMVAE